MKRTTLLCALGLSLFAFSGTASAKHHHKFTAAELASKSSKILKVNLKAKTALGDLGAVAVTQARALKTPFGRIDGVSTTRTPMALMVNNVRAAYRSGKPMASGYKVIGYAKQDRKGSYIVTLLKDGMRQYVELKSVPEGTLIQYRSWRLKHHTR